MSDRLKAGPSKSPAISRKPGPLKGANLRKLPFVRSCSEERFSLTGFGFVSCLNKGIAFALYRIVQLFYHIRLVSDV